MQQEREMINQRLKDELSDVYFDRTDQLLQQTHPQTWIQRWRVLWNKEVELPLLPIGILATLLIGWTIIQQADLPLQQDAARSPRHLIEAGGNTYWSDAYEKAVERSAN
jgi:hypothetical protein